MRRTRILFCAATVAALALVTVLSADAPGVLAIRHARILSMAGPEIADGTILVRGETIEAVGRDTAVPKDARIIDAGGGVVMPGFVDPHFSLAELTEARETGVDETSDPNTAALQVLDGLNPFDKRLPRMLRAGITSALVTPGRANVIGGQVAVVRLAGQTVNEMTVLSPAGIKFSLGEGPKAAFGEKGRLPSTRMGAAFIVRKALLEASEYRQKWSTFKAKGGGTADPPSRDLALEALAALLEGSLPAFIECYRADDIVTALRLVDEFKLKAVLVGVTEGQKVAAEIAKRKVPVIVGPIGIGPKRMETQDVEIGLAAALARAGVSLALQGEGAMGIGAPEELPMVAALAVKGGLPRDAALKAVTIGAAEMLGVSKQIGSLEPGKSADLVILSGDPLHYRTQVRTVIVKGSEVPR